MKINQICSMCGEYKDQLCKCPMSHTPTPWNGDQFTMPETIRIASIDGKSIAGLAQSVKNKANAEFIVRAVNSHEELLEASQGLLNALQARLMRTGCNGPEESAIKALKQAIAKAEGR